MGFVLRRQRNATRTTDGGSQWQRRGSARRPLAVRDPRAVWMGLELSDRVR